MELLAFVLIAALWWIGARSDLRVAAVARDRGLAAGQPAQGAPGGNTQAAGVEK